VVANAVREKRKKKKIKVSALLGWQYSYLGSLRSMDVIHLPTSTRNMMRCRGKFEHLGLRVALPIFDVDYDSRL
jgi:hypothetical protein